MVNLDPAAEHFGYPVLAGEFIINIFQFVALFHFHALSVIISMTMKFKETSALFWLLKMQPYVKLYI